MKQLGFRGNLAEWERLMGAVARRQARIATFLLRLRRAIANSIRHAQFYRWSHQPVIRVYDDAGRSEPETARARWRVQRAVRLTFLFVKCPRHIEGLESQRQPRVAILHLRRSNRRNLYNIDGASANARA